MTEKKFALLIATKSISHTGAIKCLKSNVKIGNLCLNQAAKMGYNECMLVNFISIVLRISLVAAIWICLWRFVQPRTQSMRLLRAALLVLCLLGVLLVLRVTGGN